jgi:hypothetical protein
MSKSLELTDEQADAVVRSIPPGAPMYDRRAIVKRVWKECAQMFRDQVLEEAAKEVEDMGPNEFEWAADAIREMKGSK